MTQSLPPLHERILKYGAICGFLWGLAEGVFFFIVPDVLISYVALFSLRRSAVVVAMSLLGSALAGIVLYIMAQAEPNAAKEFMLSLPFVTPKMFTSAQAHYVQQGMWGLLYAPVSGSPFKVYAVLAPAYVSFVPFLVVGMAARAVRFACVSGISHLAAYFLSRGVPKTPMRKLTICYSICWIVFYAFYWWRGLSS